MRVVPYELPETSVTSADLPRPAGEKHFKQLTAAEAGRALYIDVEGEKDKPPVLLGILRRRGRGPEPAVHQLTVDADFETLADEALAFIAAVERVVIRAEARDCRIVSWTEHDLEVVRRLRDEDPDLVARFEARYANGKRVAERWMNKLHHDGRLADGKLTTYLAHIGYDVPHGGRAGQVAHTIKSMRPTLHGGRPLTARQQERWAELREHNRHDCAGMKAVCLLATREIDAADQAGPGRGSGDQ